MNILQQKAIKHYDKMIRYAKTQLPGSKVSRTSMYKNIGQYWEGDDCPYCQREEAGLVGYLVETKLSPEDLGGFGFKESECPLGPCDLNCCNGLWTDMDLAETWGEWIEAAKQVREYIREKG